jgi:hypothetical protein
VGISHKAGIAHKVEIANKAEIARKAEIGRRMPPGVGDGAVGGVVEEAAAV